MRLHSNRLISFAAISSCAAVLAISASFSSGCRGGAGTSRTAATELITLSVAEQAACGNGVVDPGEVCDHAVEYEDACPDVWGMCLFCDKTCKGYVLWGPAHGRIDERRVGRIEALLGTSAVPPTHPSRTLEPLASVTFDRNGDGKNDYSERREYDDHGRPTLFRLDWDSENSPDFVASWTYDSSGNETSYEWDGHRNDGGANGQPDYRGRWKYDVNGNKTLAEQDGDREDGGADGKIDYRERWKYDRNGNKTLYELDGDLNPGGRNQTHGPFDKKVDHRERWKWDSENRKTFYELDFDADGSFDEREWWQYNASGNTVDHRKAVSNYEGGYHRYHEAWEYNDAGQKVVEKSFEEDGTTSRCERYTYDADGRMTLRQHCLNPNEEPAYSERWVYDTNGNMTLNSFERHDGVSENATRWTYDSKNNKTLEGTYREGALIRRTRWKYDSSGRKLLEEFDIPVDGKWDGRIRWGYDKHGNKILEEHDKDADGVWVKRERWKFDARGNQTFYEMDDFESKSHGGPQRRSVYREYAAYDKANRKTLTAYDGRRHKGGGDGVIDYWERKAFDKRGRTILVTGGQNSPTLGSGEKVDWLERWAYDPNGNQTLYERDRTGKAGRADGNIELLRRWKYDANGRMTLHEYYSGSGIGRTNRKPNESIRYKYDTKGNLVRQEADKDGDGQADETLIWKRTYDDAGNETMTEAFGRDGSWLSMRKTMTYDAKGNVVLVESHSGKEAFVTSRLQYTYDRYGYLKCAEHDSDGDGSKRPSRVCFDTGRLTQILSSAPKAKMKNQQDASE